MHSHSRDVTYNVIRNWVRGEFGLCIKTCSIADMTEQCGLRLRTAPNRIDALKRKYPCPDAHKPAILAAFLNFGLITTQQR